MVASVSHTFESAYAMTSKVPLNPEMIFLTTARRWGIDNRWAETGDFVRHPTGARTDPHRDHPDQCAIRVDKSDRPT